MYTDTYICVRVGQKVLFSMARILLLCSPLKSQHT